MPSRKFLYVESLAAQVEIDSALETQLKNDPKAALRDIAASPLQTDVWIYRIVVIALGSAVLITLVAVSCLAGLDKKVSEGVIAIGSTAAGALAGLLAPSPKGEKGTL